MRTYAVVGLGGILGSILRFAITEDLPRDVTYYAIAGINIVGCAVLGLVLTKLRSLLSMTEETWNSLGKPFFATGVLGGFTTTSSFAVASIELFQDQPLEAFSYVAMSVIGGYWAFRMMAGKDVAA